VTPAPIPASVQAHAPDIACRVALILANLAALVAYRFLKDPHFNHLILPLWTRLTHTATRFERLLARIAVNRAPKPRPTRPHRKTQDTVRKVSPFPTTDAWLLVAIPYHAAGYASQLAALLAEPTTIALFAAYPTAARLLNPFARMLGLPPIAQKRQASPQPRPSPPPPPPLPRQLLQRRPPQRYRPSAQWPAGCRRRVAKPA
jgi:hypothetical protein